MAYTILINEDNSLYASKKETVMQRSKLVDNLVFIVDPIYKGVDMTDFSVVLEYLLPVSRKYETINLVLCEERYKDYFLQYKLPFDCNLTSERGGVEVQLTFVKVELDENGNGIQRVRKTTPTIINITPISAWSDIVPDSALSALDQRLIKTDAQIRALSDLANTLEANQVDDLIYDDNEEFIKLSSKGNPIGQGVSVRDMLDDGAPVIDFNSINGNPESPVEASDVVEF